MKTRRALLRAFVTWLLIWPLVMVGFLVLKAVAPTLPMPMQTLVLTALLVPTISFGLAPLVSRFIPDRDAC